MKRKRIGVIGGGAAGFFGAIAAKEKNRDHDVILFEKTKALLAKVKISGGGRCNVTHSCFDPKKLVQFYPRGHKELLGPFHYFQPQDTIEWFAARGVALKTEKDGRMFPTTDSSETIIQCLMEQAQRLGIEIRTQSRIEKIGKGFVLSLNNDETFHCDTLLLASGSSQEGYAFAHSLSHTIVSPIPSLFTFNIPNSPLKEYSGISVDDVEIKVQGISHIERGPLLITHFGFSGPAVLKFSAWAARELHEKKYCAELVINWVKGFPVQERLLALKKSAPDQTLITTNPFALPRNLWRELIKMYDKKMRDLSHKEISLIEEKLSKDCYQIQGKTMHKEEFVTCGGVELKEVNFKTMESRLQPGLFFAGEILNIDGVTGGFNFQNAWTTGKIAGDHMAI